MDFLKEEITTEQICLVMVLFMIAGYGVLFMNSLVEYSSSILFMGLGITLLFGIAVSGYFKTKS